MTTVSISIFIFWNWSLLRNSILRLNHLVWLSQIHWYVNLLCFQICVGDTLFFKTWSHKKDHQDFVFAFLNRQTTPPPHIVYHFLCHLLYHLYIVSTYFALLPLHKTLLEKKILILTNTIQNFPPPLNYENVLNIVVYGVQYEIHVYWKIQCSLDTWMIDSL